VELRACRTPGPQQFATAAVADHSLQPFGKKRTLPSEGGTLSGAGEQIVQNSAALKTFLARARKSQEVFRMAPDLQQRDLSNMLKELHDQEKHSNL